MMTHLNTKSSDGETNYGTNMLRYTVPTCYDVPVPVPAPQATTLSTFASEDIPGLAIH
jgi:hypothetical protein